MIYNDLDQFLNKDSITNPVKINSWNVDSIIASWALPSTSIEGWVTKTYNQNSAPTTWMNIGDVWYDTDDWNHAYRWDGSSWISIRDTWISPSTLDTRWFTNWLTFSSTWYSNITWTSGTLTFASWDTYSISAGYNTDTTTSPVYIYLDVSVPTTLQATTTAANAVWDNRCLVCVKKTNSDSSKKAIFQVMWWADSWVFITADNIAANTITANEIASNTITATNIDTSTILIWSLSGAWALASEDSVDWSTQVSWTWKPANNADVTGDNTSADTAKVQWYTMISWWYISTWLITADRIQTWILTVTSSWVWVKVASWGDIVFESDSYSSFSQIKFTRKDYSNQWWDIEFTPTGWWWYNAGAMNFIPQSSNTYKTIWFGKLWQTANIVVTWNIDCDYDIYSNKVLLNSSWRLRIPVGTNLY